jgi:hypothetical protein
MAEGLARGRGDDLVGLGRRQRAFFDSLGENGVEVIVEDVAESCAAWTSHERTAP